MGLNLKIARIKKGFTQEEVCKSVGIGRTTLSQLEQGKKDPKLSVLIKLSKVLDVTVEELISDEG